MDLVVSEQWFGGRRYFVVKDPLTLVYSYLTEQEHFILAQLDGQTSLSEIQTRFLERFRRSKLGQVIFMGFWPDFIAMGWCWEKWPGRGSN